MVAIDRTYRPLPRSSLSVRVPEAEAVDVASRRNLSAAWGVVEAMRRLIAAFAVVAALAFAGSAYAAAPNYILVSGPGLRTPVVMDNWSENHRLLLAAADAPRARPAVTRGLRLRPRFDLALFWGWADRPRPTRAADANQHGWFYPAHGSGAAVIEIMVNGLRVARVAPARVLLILIRNGVPVRR